MSCCTFLNNSTSSYNYGGAINNFGTMTVTDSSFSGNSAWSGGGINGEIAALNRILDIAFPDFRLEGGTMIVPGHGRLCDIADVAYYRDMVTIVRDRVQDQIKKGKTLEQIKAAKLLDISPTRVRLRLGRLGMLSGWGRVDDRKPVDVELDLSSEVPAREVNGRLVKSNQVLVRVQIRPVGKPRSPEEFDERCRQVVKQLSTYFLADL